MSCVAYKDGVLAADSRAYGGNWQASPGQKAKIHLLPDAIGSGCDYAMGAMEAGATAEEAVRIACSLDPHCGEPVMVLP